MIKIIGNNVEIIDDNRSTLNESEMIYEDSDIIIYKMGEEIVLLKRNYIKNELFLSELKEIEVFDENDNSIYSMMCRNDTTFKNFKDIEELKSQLRIKNNIYHYDIEGDYIKMAFKTSLDGSDFIKGESYKIERFHMKLRNCENEYPNIIEMMEVNSLNGYNNEH